MLPRSINVFIGSSTESRPYAEIIQALLVEMGGRIFAEKEFTVTGWWVGGVFPSGQTTVEALEQVLNDHSAAILVGGAEDTVISRTIEKREMRSNVLFEYGMFCGRHGRNRVALATWGDITKPLDLAGITDIRLQLPLNSNGKADLTRFKEANRESIRTWLDQLYKLTNDQMPTLEDLLPRLSASIITITKSLKGRGGKFGGDIDVLASELVSMLAEGLDAGNNGIDDLLMDGIRKILPTATRIHAVDVLGPGGWVSPKTFRYLAPQIKTYIRRNCVGDEWHLTVDEPLGNAIRIASENARKLVLPGGGFLEESSLPFDNPKEFKWGMGVPKLQFSRILLWSEEELASSVAESVIAIHEAFNVPLFFLPTPRADKIRDIDYIYFSSPSNVSGFFGYRQKKYSTKPIRDNGRITGLKDTVNHTYEELLRRADLLFAIDAREALNQNAHLRWMDT